MVTLVMRSKVALTPPPALKPGELALGLGNGAVRMWAGDASGTPVEFGTDANGFVRKTGDTMSGPLVLTAVNPTDANHATRKAYVDTQVNGRMTQAQADARYLQPSGGTLTGFLTLHAKPTAALHPATKNYVDDLLATYYTSAVSDARFLPLVGGTLTGALTLPSGNPTNDNHATRKGYVDAQVNGRLTQAQGDVRYAAKVHTHVEADVTDLDRLRCGAGGVLSHRPSGGTRDQIGRASCRERV